MMERQLLMMAVIKKELKMPIETLACDCDYKNKHKAYYFEWALNERVAK